MCIRDSLGRIPQFSSFLERIMAGMETLTAVLASQMMSCLLYTSLSEDAKRQIFAWKYGGEYDLYNLPSYEEMQVRQIGFIDVYKRQLLDCA